MHVFIYFAANLSFYMFFEYKCNIYIYIYNRRSTSEDFWKMMLPMLPLRATLGLLLKQSDTCLQMECSMKDDVASYDKPSCMESCPKWLKALERGALHDPST
jgi:hypothetical protein